MKIRVWLVTIPVNRFGTSCGTPSGLVPARDVTTVMIDDGRPVAGMAVDGRPVCLCAASGFSPRTESVRPCGENVLGFRQQVSPKYRPGMVGQLPGLARGLLRIGGFSLVSGRREYLTVLLGGAGVQVARALALSWSNSAWVIVPLSSRPFADAI